MDHSSVIGGLEVGEAKLLKGKLGEYISTVTYAREPSYLSEMNKVDSFDLAKKEEVKGIYRRFSQ